MCKRHSHPGRLIRRSGVASDALRSAGPPFLFGRRGLPCVSRCTSRSGSNASKELLADSRIGAVPPQPTLLNNLAIMLE
jgi:hypothetical protein